MLAATNGSQIYVGIVYTVIAALILLVVRAVLQTRSKSQTDKRDTISTNTFLFGKDANPRTGEPGTKGWTTKVDDTLESQNRAIGEISGSVHTLSGDLHRLGNRIIGNTDAAAAKIIEGATTASKSAADEVVKQVTERERVLKRDDAHDAEQAAKDGP